MELAAGCSYLQPVHAEEAKKVVNFQKEAVTINIEPLRSGIKLIELDQNDSEYKSVKDRFFENMGFKIRISKIERIENPALETLYNLNKMLLAVVMPDLRELRLFHGTKYQYINSILMNNLDYRRCKAAMFGKGVSFSQKAWYSTYYTDSDSSDEKMLLCDVLIGKEHSGDWNLELPNNGYDTTTSENVIVKYHDDTFLPKYLITFTRCNGINTIVQQ